MRSFITALLLCASASASFAQSDSTQVITKIKPAIESPVFKKNNVKINLSSLALNNYSLSIERFLTSKVSFAAGYNLMPKTNLGDMTLTQQLADKFLKDGNGIREQLDQAHFSNHAYTGELRLYTGKHAGPRGFYISAYGRYTKMEFDYLGSYKPFMGDEIPLPYVGKLDGFGGGLMFGAQWLIANRVTLDWYIVGAHYGKLGGDINIIQDFRNMPESNRRDLENEIEERFTVGGKQLIEATITDNGGFGKVDAPFMGIRGFGINLGLAF